MPNRSVSLVADDALEGALTGDALILVVDLSRDDISPPPLDGLEIGPDQWEALAALPKWDGAPRLEQIGFAPSADAPVRLSIFAYKGEEMKSTARQAGAALARGVVKAGLKDVAVVFADGIADDAHFAVELIHGFKLRYYDFRKFRTSATLAGDRMARFLAPSETVEALQTGVEAIAPISEAVHLCRDLVSDPPNVLTTTQFRNAIKELATDTLTVEVLDEKKLEKLGFRGLLAVGAGSQSPSYVVVMRDKRNGTTPPDVCLIGKGLTFDSGGLSLKPAGSMKDMKMDMAGAGAVVAAMQALTRGEEPASVVGIVGLVENMPDGAAARPGDVLTMRTGTTVEVVNTDAEGRLVLADLFSYANDIVKPKCMVNLATLTGGVITALGHDIAGLFSNSDALSEQLLAAAETEDEELWRMPLKDFHRKMLNSDIADIKQTGGPTATAISSAKFLEEFVDETPWAHIDIAGVAFTHADGKYWPKGATGWGVPMLVRFCREVNAEAMR